MPELADISRTCACLHTRMAARAVTRAYDEALRPVGLKITQFALLASIEMKVGGSISDLAERLAFERTTLTRNLRLLKDAGLIAPKEGTGRAVAFDLTPAGRDALQRAVPLWEQAQGRIEAAIGATAWEETRAGLKAVRKAAWQGGETPGADQRVDSPARRDSV